MSDKARLAAYNAVKRIFGGAYSNLIQDTEKLEGLDRAFAESIILGTLERKVTLEWVLSKMLQKETKPEIMILLMTGIYQIVYMDKVPESAACDETVKIAKELFGRNTAGFVNAVMRNVCRRKADILAELDNAEGYIRYSANRELFALLEKQYPEDIERIFDAFFGKVPTFVRVNTQVSNAAAVAEKIGGAVINETAVRCDNTARAVSEIGSGEFYIQGMASQKAVALLGANPNDTVIDVCACPGGKSLGAAIDMQNKGAVYSFDLHANKLPLIKKSAEKLGISIITTEKHDARKPKEEFIGKADKVICDVPCSGTGVMGSKPEIKYKSPEDFKGIYPTQRAIIQASSKYLKVGGVMVYSTCSINRIENEEVIAEFLENNRNFKLIYEKTCLPFEEENEGFYMAKIIREN